MYVDGWITIDMLQERGNKHVHTPPLLHTPPPHKITVCGITEKQTMERGSVARAALRRTIAAVTGRNTALFAPVRTTLGRNATRCGRMHIHLHYCDSTCTTRNGLCGAVQRLYDSTNTEAHKPCLHFYRFQALYRTAMDNLDKEHTARPHFRIERHRAAIGYTTVHESAYSVVHAYSA